MSNIGEKTLDLEELTEPRKPLGDKEYLDWAEAKIRKSIADDDARPEHRISLDEAMKKYGAD